MKKLRNAVIVSILGMTALLPQAEASAILRAEFNPTATTYGLDNAIFGSTTATNGDATLINGSVSTLNSGNLVGNSYYDGADASVIRINFLNPVAAFGLDWNSNNANPTLSVFNSANVLLESLTLDWTQFPAPDGYPTGFIGLNVGINSIAYATIDTPRNGNELYVDNLIYQRTAAVPVPATLPLLAIGAASLIAIRRRKAK